MKTFAEIPEKFSSFKNAEILLQPVPFDGTSTWGKGAEKGFDAFMEAADNMELFDIETDSEPFKKGIHVLDSVSGNDATEMHDNVYARTNKLLQSGKFLTFIGGEHSISIGIIKAFYKKFPNITVLQLDAHADLRPEYLGSKYNHACALYDASMNTNLIQVGIRSMDNSEKLIMDLDKVFFMHDIHDHDEWVPKAIQKIGKHVYITIDLDVFDPSVFPATGTPEPGGLLWYPALHFLKKVFETKDVLGFDLVEHAPIPGFRAADFLVAKLYYKLLSFKFCSDGK